MDLLVKGNPGTLVTDTEAPVSTRILHDMPPTLACKYGRLCETSTPDAMGADVSYSEVSSDLINLTSSSFDMSWSWLPRSD